MEKSKVRSWGVGLVALTLAAAVSGCGAVSDKPSEEEVSAEEAALFPNTNAIWRSLNVPVCWESMPASQATERQWVRDAVFALWEVNSKVRFTGWTQCTTGAPGIHIRVADVRANTTTVGRFLDGVTSGMTLNFLLQSTAQPDYVRCVQDHGLETCVRGLAVHEFGHALGFSHEQNRSDAGDTTLCPKSGSDGTVRVGAYDTLSVMNFCNPLWVLGPLSATDKLGLQSMYGSSSTIKKEAFSVDSSLAYFFAGSNYVAYDMVADRLRTTDSVNGVNPRSITSGWSGWPSTWTTGVDASVDWGNGKVYLFRGSNYVRANKSTRVVESSPAPIIGNWPGWPTTWTTVDASVNWGNGSIYFFRGSQYLRYSIALDKVTQAPKAISGNWPGLTFTSGIESVLPSRDGLHLYFFKGNDYVKYAKGNSTTPEGQVAGYPVPIVSRWPGVIF